MAARQGISVKTADCHRTRIMDKLNVHQTANLVRYAIREGLVQPQADCITVLPIDIGVFHQRTFPNSFLAVHR